MAAGRRAICHKILVIQYLAMVTQELLDYIQGELTRGIGKDEIIQALVASGWTTQDVNDALTTLLSPKPVTAPVASEPATPIVQAPTTPAIATTPIENPTPAISQPASTLEEKVAKIETIYDTTIAKVTELGGEQRQIVTDSIKGLEQRKLEEVKKRLGLSQST